MTAVERSNTMDVDALAEAFPTTFQPHLQDFQQLAPDAPAGA